MVVKKDYTRSFTIPFTIGMFQFAMDLSNLGASINFMAFTIYKNLGLGQPSPKTMRLLMVDHRKAYLIFSMMYW